MEVFHFSSWLPAVVLVILVFWVLYESVFCPFTLWLHYKNQGLPGTSYTPFIGDLLKIMKIYKESEYFYKAISGNEGFDNSFFFLGPELCIRTVDPSLASALLTTHAAAVNKAKLLKRAMGGMIGKGLLLKETSGADTAT
jgi:hypothetical protein